MIAIVGGSGRLGRLLGRRLLDRGETVRLVARSRSRVPDDLVRDTGVVEADVTDPASLVAAVQGVDVVVSAISGFGGANPLGASAVDERGNLALIAAAEEAGVDRFVLLSVLRASPDSRVGLFRAKAAAEARLRASRLSPTIVRPTAYAETWLELVGRPIADTGRTRVFGSGRNPVNFVSAEDVAAIVERVATDDRWRGAEVDVPGPQDLTLDALAETAARAAGVDARISHTPRLGLRVVAAVAGVVRPAFADQVRAAILMDTADMRVDASRRRQLFPDVPLTTVDQVAATMFAARGVPAAATVRQASQ